MRTRYTHIGLTSLYFILGLYHLSVVYWYKQNCRTVSGRKLTPHGKHACHMTRILWWKQTEEQSEKIPPAQKYMLISTKWALSPSTLLPNTQSWRPESKKGIMTAPQPFQSNNEGSYQALLGLQVWRRKRRNKRDKTGVKTEMD